MRKIFFVSFLLFILLSCKSINDSKVSIKQRQEKIQFFEISDFYFSINEKNVRVIENKRYQIDYDYLFRFKNKDGNFNISYTLYDEDMNVILKEKNIKPLIDGRRRNGYIIKKDFKDIFYYSKIYFRMKILIDNEKKEYTGEFKNPVLPDIKINIGPIISSYIDEKFNVSLLINISIKNCRTIRSIRFIPPSEDSFWEIPWEYDFNEIIAKGNIYERDNNYLENGDYLLQIDLDKYGILEKNIKIKDFFNNEKGPNYGMPIAYESAHDKNHIKLDIDLLEKIDFMELWIFKIINDEMQKIGTAKFLTSIETISKKVLRELVKDDFENKVKIKYNKEYFYKVYLYSKEFNGISYLSISEPFKFSIQGFDFFGF